MTRSSFSVLFAPREGRTKKDGKAPIEARITINGERTTFTTGKLVRYDQWDNVKQIKPSL